MPSTIFLSWLFSCGSRGLQQLLAKIRFLRLHYKSKENYPYLQASRTPPCLLTPPAAGPAGPACWHWPSPSRSRALLSPCTDTDVAFTPVSCECPFDPTHVCRSALSLGAVSLLLDSMEIVFSIRCLLLTLRLLHLGCCCRGSLVSLQAAPVESPDPRQCLGLLRLHSGEAAWV
ncbi:transmembrane protein 54 [Strigops habroptila]|uniref:transmembrane protein 54 n=1 Tax=Strigops habroptila TaxID=2489341 RepID=UPI0011D02F0D|nr:transmembrane protein 54 [Strigops habroptila]